MNELSLEKEITKLERYLRREGREDFVTEMMGAGPSELDSKMLKLAKEAEEIQDAQNNDEGLRAAKAEASNLGAPYRDRKKMNKKLTRFVALMMQEKGKL